MPRKMIYPKEVTDHDARRLAEPAALATIVLCFLLIFPGIAGVYSSNINILLIFLGGVGIVYAIFLFYVVSPSPLRIKIYKWPIVITNEITVVIGLYWLPRELQIIPLFVMVLISIVIYSLWDRRITNYFIGTTGVLYFLLNFNRLPSSELLTYSSFFLIALIFVETIGRLYVLNQKRIGRLQAINQFVHHVSASIEVNEVIELIGSALKNAIQADTYFFGLKEDDQLAMKLIYDDGEFFPPEQATLEGSLSGWVIRNQESLFVADFRSEIDLEGVKLVLLGKAKTSLCWMGVPVHAQYIDGIIAVASYKPNDFNRTDLDLLENLGQQASLVLDNAFHHKEVQTQANLDSLTGVYNHGYIVNFLNDSAQLCVEVDKPLSLIMLDIDHFKQYNDKYGHMVGDQVLTILSQTLKQHIKSTDAVGRWGGEEFTIVLPGTNGLQAQQVAERVRESVNSLTLHDRDGNLLAFPTVSQGLALFPSDASDVTKLLDMADQRLYIAKVRGRNQMEPKLNEWNQ